MVKISLIQLKMHQYHRCWARVSGIRASWNGLLSSVAWGQCVRRWFRHSILSAALCLCSFLLWLPTSASPCPGNHVPSQYLPPALTLSNPLLPTSTQTILLPSLPGSAPGSVGDKLFAAEPNRAFLLPGNRKATLLALFLTFHFPLCFIPI